MRLRSLLVTVLFFLVIFSSCRASFADGFYMPPPYIKLPDIPVQRALLKYRDGVETLVVESTLDGPGQKFGWIIPVPSIPKKFEKITPGLLKTLSFTLQPTITDHFPDTRDKASLRLLFTVLFPVWALAMFLKCLSILRKGCSDPWSIIRYDLWLAIIMIVGVPFFIMVVLELFSVYGSGGPLAELTAVRVESRHVVGDYEISVVRAGKSSDLNTWLEDNGFRSFPDKAVPAVDDYIAKQWVFVAAKISREGQGTATPHPILIEFHTDRPVYPMRLTALSGSPVKLELFILASKEAVPVSYELKKEYCDYFDYKFSNVHFYHFRERESFLFSSRTVGRSIGHPIAIKLMWSGCVLTKLAGEIPSDQMKKDMFFSLKEAAPYRSHVYSSQWVIERGFIVAIIVGLFGLQGLCYLYKTRKRVSAMSLPALLIVCLAIFFAIYFRFEKAEVTSGLGRSSWSHFKTAIWYLKWDIYEDVRIDPMDPESDHLIKLRATAIENPFTNKPVIVEDSPGNITWERKYDSIFFTGYLPDGTPHVNIDIRDMHDLETKHLLAAIKDSDPEIRCAAAFVLGFKKQAPAVNSLIAALKDENPRVLQNAAEALGKLKNPRAVEPLIAVLEDGVPYVHDAASTALERITGDRVGKSPTEWREWWEQNKKAAPEGG